MICASINIKYSKIFCKVKFVTYRKNKSKWLEFRNTILYFKCKKALFYFFPRFYSQGNEGNQLGRICVEHLIYSQFYYIWASSKLLENRVLREVLWGCWRTPLIKTKWLLSKIAYHSILFQSINNYESNYLYNIFVLIK